MTFNKTVATIWSKDGVRQQSTLYDNLFNVINAVTSIRNHREVTSLQDTCQANKANARLETITHLPFHFR